MILTCPRCATRYLIDDQQVWSSGRTVRCEACGEQWRAVGAGVRPGAAAPERAPAIESPEQAAPSAAPEPEAPVEPVAVEPAAAESAAAEPVAAGADDAPFASFRSREGARRQQALGMSAPLMIATAAAVALVLAAAVAVYDRAEIMRVAPGTASLFAAMGLETPHPAPPRLERRR